MSSARSDGRVQPACPGDPKRVGPYRIIGRLGSGGMGTVHAGLDPAGLRVAVKLVHAAHSADAEFRARFRREVQLSTRVHGPCLMPLLAADPEADTPWLATAYAPGPTLDQHIAAHGPLTGGTLYAFAAGTAQALAAIHDAGVVHRDVKPQNVILTPAGPRVLDFGIARAADGTSVTRTGVMTGTPGWISPEHYRTGAVGPEGDVFAWGILVAHAATGRLPFGTGAPDVVAYRVMSAEPDLAGLPGELRGIVASTLVKTPEGRPAAHVIAEECAGILAAQATRVLPPAADPTLACDPIGAEWDVPAADDPSWRPPARPGRRAVGITLATGAVVAGLTGGVFALRSADAAPPPASARPHGTAGSTTAATPSAAPPGARSGSLEPASADSAEATIATWRTARRARGEAELETGAALSHDVSLGVGPDHDYDGRYEVGFAPPRKEVYIAIRGTAPAPYIVQEVARDACTSLRMMADIHADLPYDEYVLVDATTPAAPAIVWEGNFRTNTGCATRAADRDTTGGPRAREWQPTETGWEAARIPSSDKAEIRVATDAVHRLFGDWNGNSRLVHDPRYISDENTSIGFAPHEGVMYVWASKPEWNRDTQQEWAEAAADVACEALLAESRAPEEWAYARYAVGVVGDDGRPRFLRWATVGACRA
ncbi:serine/threonine-protein kinase [Streptomyces sp. WM6372]|uniref:serine/threonine-protein kinase n=1 Tax=Streptomyces sp. WM6372 TaxID=1415555 RepID=UPI0006AF06BE|nr:serine/threonine-protein kinase [Streptomyces sp. WM6372]